MMGAAARPAACRRWSAPPSVEMGDMGMRGRRFVARWVAALVVGLLGVLALAPPVGAAAPISLIVTNALDNVNDANCTVGSCTLRQAVNASNANDPARATTTRSPSRMG
jgi:hypothetical protein